LALDSGIVHVGSHARPHVALARNACTRFPDVSCPDHRPQALGKGRLLVASVATLRLGPAPLRVARVSVDSSSPVWLPKKASLRSVTGRQLPGPFPRIGRQSSHSLLGFSRDPHAVRAR
jgi:hypothetical protein